jgi:hypothetical protein
MRTEVGDLVAVGQQRAVRCLGGTEGDDALRGQGEQFVALADAVLVEVAPEAQIGKVRVERIDLPVAVAVFLRERGKAVGGRAASGKRSGIAKKFVPVIAGHPAGGGLHAIAIVVERNGGGGVDADGFETIAVEVENERIAANEGCVRASENRSRHVVSISPRRALSLFLASSLYWYSRISSISELSTLLAISEAYDPVSCSDGSINGSPGSSSEINSTLSRSASRAAFRTASAVSVDGFAS